MLNTEIPLQAEKYFKIQYQFLILFHDTLCFCKANKETMDLSTTAKKLTHSVDFDQSYVINLWHMNFPCNDQRLQKIDICKDIPDPQSRQ